MVVLHQRDVPGLFAPAAAKPGQMFHQAVMALKLLANLVGSLPAVMARGKLTRTVEHVSINTQNKR